MDCYARLTLLVIIKTITVMYNSLPINYSAPWDALEFIGIYDSQFTYVDNEFLRKRESTSYSH